MAENKKHTEALARLKAAEKSLKTNIFKWRPDYEVAAREFSNAATCFKACKSYELSKECFIKASDSYKHINSLYNAAKCMDHAMIVGKEANAYREIPSLAERASCLHQQCGGIEAALASLEKGAKILEINYPQEALNLYQKATDISIADDNVRQAGEYASKISRLMIKLKLYDQAADAIRREIALYGNTENNPTIGRLACALVLVQLARGDIVAAEKAFKEWGNHCDPPELQNLEMLLRGFDDEDPDTVKRALNHSFFRHMDIEYTRLIKEIALPVGTTGPKPALVRENAAEEYVSLNVAVGLPRPSTSAMPNFDEHGNLIPPPRPSEPKPKQYLPSKSNESTQQQEEKQEKEPEQQQESEEQQEEKQEKEPQQQQESEEQQEEKQEKEPQQQEPGQQQEQQEPKQEKEPQKQQEPETNLPVYDDDDDDDEEGLR